METPAGMRSNSVNSRVRAYADNAEPSRRFLPAEGVETGRARPNEFASATSTVKAQSRPRTGRANGRAAKAEVVRKSAAREGIRVRASVIPYERHPFNGIF
jgi:hypothetical protein